MYWLHTYLSTVPLFTASVVAFTLFVRCLTLLAGLLATLAKSSPGDRPEIYREFARATSGRPIRSGTLTRRSARANGRKEPDACNEASSFLP